MLKEKLAFFPWLLFAVLSLQCAGFQKSHNLSNTLLFKDNYWINADTLQLVVTETGGENPQPHSLGSEKACKTARENIKPKLYELYPKSVDKKFRIKIIRELINNPGECTVVAHIRGPGLKRNIQ